MAEQEAEAVVASFVQTAWDLDASRITDFEQLGAHYLAHLDRLTDLESRGARRFPHARSMLDEVLSVFLDPV